MRRLLSVALLMLVSGFIGFAIGRNTAPKPDPQEIHAVAVDCYDSNGKLTPNQFADLGGVQLSCAPGQTARLHQPAAK
jgi:hypothetical protein